MKSILLTDIRAWQGWAARMLLRSTSSPLLNSWLPSSCSSLSCPCSSKEAHHESFGVSAEVVAIPRAPRRPVITHALSDPDLSDLSAPVATVRKRRPLTASHKDEASPRQTHDQDITHCIAGKSPRSSLLLSSSGLVDATSFPSFKSGVHHDSILSNGFAGEGGGGSGNGYLGFSAERNEDDEDGKKDGSTTVTDAYYQKMIQANPGNSLIVGNYAKFLKEVSISYFLLNSQRYRLINHELCQIQSPVRLMEPDPRRLTSENCECRSMATF